MITLTDVTKTYGGLRVLGPVDLHIPAGGVTALVGPNGAGKSTLLTIVGRLTEPTTGTVTVGGLDVARTPSRDLARVVSILRQENHFVTRLTVRDLVGFGRFPHSGGRLNALDRRHVDEALRFLDLDDLAHRYLDQLSGGQRQRAYVAMVLAQDTECILLDEPLNNLDMKHAVAMMRQLRRAADELGKTVVVVIHDINFAAAYADRIVALTGGAVACAGTPAEIMRPEVLEPVFQTPIEIRDDGAYPLAVYFR
ncbi:iron ABC transporter ATP-binding protein [Microbacterium imperiale]|uniref:Iron ABC transporter ATP-binding protein n=1 Tax=Microbacterium imperiale TaxID=33884 RepID=A0A9W6HJ00_9MICO|nr:ATP-binding cassette domain-containing protein [Microbacterium imperiale]MBP2421670.1 iron complex transport system ATP-binding protein [Microbacterium imperiale]MDS0199227.1 ATP-binding cassette domain-containing protein [Microbacterium imperiale]BFE42012.1 ATP-binding cassette domain-containing protein [Microbacterium imperiale]GLJ80965.1 iron ABC transporter ATP-binding protein [Microbacterium imperiale]